MACTVEYKGAVLPVDHETELVYVIVVDGEPRKAVIRSSDVDGEIEGLYYVGTAESTWERLRCTVDGEDCGEQLIRVVEVRALTDGAVSDAVGCDVELGQSAGWRRLPGGVAFSLGLSLDPEARIRCGLEVGRGLDAPYGQRDFATVDEMADWARGMAGDDVADALVRLAAII